MFVHPSFTFGYAGGENKVEFGVCYYFIIEKNVRFFQLGRFGLGQTGNIQMVICVSLIQATVVESVNWSDVAVKKMKCAFSYSCPSCPKTYRSISGFRGHVMKVHSLLGLKGM